MGQSGGYKNESGSLKCPTTACQVKWAQQMSGASLPVSPTSQSDSWSLMRPHSETFGRGSILLFKSFCAMTLNASGLSRGRDTPYTRTPRAVCVLACVLCWLNANNVEHMNLRLEHVRNYEKLRLGPTPSTASYVYYLYEYVCWCVGVYI